MKIEVEISEQMEKAISVIAKAWKLPVEKTVELLLISTLAKKGAWGDSVNQPEPGVEYVRTAEGRMLEGDELYRDIYVQMRAYIGALVVAEKLLKTLIEASKDARFDDPLLDKAYQFYKENEVYKVNKRYVQ